MARAFGDEPARNIAFQTVVLEWLMVHHNPFDLIHVHDHMAGLIPFFLKYSSRYAKLKAIPSLLTIHNGAYRGQLFWNEVRHLLPYYEAEHGGVMEWDGMINSLAAALKCATAINTVSPSYMSELINYPDTLKPLYDTVKGKCQGILNGLSLIHI